MNKVAQVEIKPECRQIHGQSKAFDKAMEHIKKNYEMWIGSQDGKSFIIELHII